MKISNIFLILGLTLALVSAQDFSYLRPGVAGGTASDKWDANEGQMLRHIYSTTVHYKPGQASQDITTTIDGKLFDADQDINVAASLISFDASSPGKNGPRDRFTHIEVTKITINGGRTAVTLSLRFVRPNIVGDQAGNINTIGYSIICIGSKFGKSPDPTSLSRAYARTGKIKDNLNPSDDVNIGLFTFPGLQSGDTPFGFSPSASEDLLCGTQNGRVYLKGCATYKLLTTVSGFHHEYDGGAGKKFRVATIPVSSDSVAENLIKVDGGDFGNSLQVKPENIYPNGGIYLHYDPGYAPGAYSNKLQAVQASIVVVMIRRTGFTNYPINLLHEDGQFIVAFGAQGYYGGDKNITQDRSEPLMDSHKVSELKLSNYQKQNMGHLYLGLQKIDKAEQFDIRIEVPLTPTDYIIEAVNKYTNGAQKIGVGALLFSTLDVCQDSVSGITTGSPSISIAPADAKATANTLTYIPVTSSNNQVRKMYHYKVENFDEDPTKKVTVSVSHNYVIPANVDTVIFDVQFDPAGYPLSLENQAKKSRVQYTIKAGAKTVGPFDMGTGIRQLIILSVTPSSTLNTLITVTSDNTDIVPSIKISEGLFYYPKVMVNGQCLNSCPIKPQFTVGYDFTTSPKSCIYCQTSINQEYSISNNGQCVCKDNYVQKPNTDPLQCILCTDTLCRTCQAPAVGSQTCDQCVQNAAKDGSGACKCKDLFYQYGSQCVSCPLGCAKCDSPTSCSSCKLSTNTAGVVTRDPQTCLCKVGFYEVPARVTDTSAVCESCSPSCVKCELSSTSCTECNQAANFKLEGNKCVCAAGYYQVGSTCVKCNGVCKTCAVSSVYCQSCHDNRDLAGIADLQYKTCKCKSPYVELDYSCVDSTCSLIDPKCQTCGIDLAGLRQKRCISCIDNRIVSQGKCVCKPGFYDSNGKCVACPSGCQQCTATTCKCVNNASPNADGGCTCRRGLVISTFSNGPYCKPCSSNCETCSDNQNKCDTCKPTFSKNDQNVCVCTGNTYQSGGRCLTCLENCQACTEANKCSRCKNGYIWDSLTAKCTLNCPARKYNGGSECLDCSTGCANCVSQFNCNRCDPDYYQYAGSCRKKCPDTTYAKDGKCYACPSQCKNCESPDICQSCSGDYILQAKKCVTECSPGTFLASSQGCISCDISCKTCKFKSKFCTSCQSPQILYQNQCYDSCPVAIVDGVCTSTCPDGKFLKDKACIDCDSKCKTCENSQSNCLTCATGFSYNGNCVDACPAKTFASGQTCLDCDISCKSCSENVFKCSQCANGFMRSGDYCVKSCEPGTYFDIRSSSCLNCGAGCKVCTSSSVCTTCYDPRLSPVGGACQKTCPNGASFAGDGDCVCNFGWLHNSVCVSTCPDGFYPTTSKTCSQCSFPCLTCSGSANNCLNCIAGYTFDPQTNSCTTKNDCPYGQIKDRSGNCRRICDSNSFYYKTGCVYRCPPGFNSNEFGGCVQTVSPSMCNSPLFQQGSSCVYNCQNGFYPDSQTRMCKPCGENCANCLSDKLCISCASGYSPNYDQSKCIQTSDCGQTQFKYNNICYSQCPFGTYAYDKLCYRSCRKGTFLYNELCYSTCPTDFCTTEACFLTCPRGTSCTSTKN